MQIIDISQFIKDQQLPDSYAQVAKEWFFPVAQQLVVHQKRAKEPLIVGINGAQGSGKSTLAELLVFIFEQHYQIKAVSLSIDDFYYTRKQRVELAEQVHPLLLTRGVPGTHDTLLAQQTLESLIQGENPTSIPRFNKAEDDRQPSSEWDTVEGHVDIIVFEGWCLGAEPQDAGDLLIPANELEESNDAELTWRNYVNQQLQTDYPALFNMIDSWIMLKAPSFHCVFKWRLQQENKLRESIKDKSRTMDEDAIKKFIQHYQRITENLLVTLPSKVDYLFELDEQRNITYSSQRLSFIASEQNAIKLLIFTDMDGSLLDHTSYSHAAANSLLGELELTHTPVIPVTSKTKSEVLFLRRSLNNQHPFIVENGAAVFIPVGYFEEQPADTQELEGYWVKEFVKPRVHWQELIEQLGAAYSPLYTSFKQLGVSGIIESTGLGDQAAVRASLRHYGEPLLWKGTEHQKQMFTAKIEAQGAQVLQGGRFIHISGCCDKGMALQWLTKQYQQMQSNTIKTLAIGDSQNDKAMLEQADIALLIRSPAHEFPKIHRDGMIYQSQKFGPEGWVEGVEQILDSLK